VLFICEQNCEPLSSKDVRSAIESLRYSPFNRLIEELQYIPKPVLFRVCGHYVHYLWDRLPEHLKADSEIQQLMSKTL